MLLVLNVLPRHHSLVLVPNNVDSCFISSRQAPLAPLQPCDDDDRPAGTQRLPPPRPGGLHPSQEPDSRQYPGPEKSHPPSWQRPKAAEEAASQNDD